MKITYIKLVNVAGFMVGSGRNIIEIKFNKSINRIVAIQGENGVGKSLLLSSLSPFAGVCNIDDRSSLNYIIEKKEGYKEIHYDLNGDIYIIKHYFKPTKDSHSVKSYISKNGEELNVNGNVTSFISLVELHLGITQETMRLVRIGSNVNSFVKLTPARRKEYIARRIQELYVYMKIYKDINDDIKLTKAMKANNNTNLYNCHISDIVVEEEKLHKLSREIKECERNKDKIISKIGKLTSLTSENDINDLRRKKLEAEASLSELKKNESLIKSMSLEDVTVDQLIKRRSDTSEEKISIQSKINSYKISIDNGYRNIEKLEINIKKVTSDNDVRSLTEQINDLHQSIDNTSSIIRNFIPLGSTSNDINQLYSSLSSFNQISSMIYTFGNKPIEVYLKLKDDNKSVDKFLKDQAKKSSSRINRDDIRILIDKVFIEDGMVFPNCDTEYMNCPYYRLFDTINDIKNKLEEESYDDETLRYIQIISNNIDNILNNIDRMENLGIPDRIREILMEKSILNRMKNRLLFFDLSELQDYLALITEYELYVSNIDRLKQYEHQLSIYKKSGIDNFINEINQIKDSINFYHKNIDVLSSQINTLNEKLSDIDTKISIVSKYNDSKKYRSIFESTITSTDKILKPLESAEDEKRELEFSLRQVTNQINITRESHKQLESRINEYNRLVKEGEKLDKEFRDLNIILEAVSTKEGMPVKYMKRYLKKIKKLTNELLSLIYGDTFTLAKFNVDEDTFEIPYVKNGHRIPDIKYSSQSELALTTMALSFSLAYNSSNKYNILLLDEVDAGLDDANRAAFLKMLYMLIDKLNAEQVFIISHNMSQMLNIPMDVIRFSDTGIRSKLQNIICDLTS